MDIKSLTNSQLDFLVDEYADKLIATMSDKQKDRFIYDSIVENMSYLSSEEVYEKASSFFSKSDIEKLIKVKK